MNLFKIKLWVLFLVTVGLIAITFTFKPIAQNPSYHLFADQRWVAGIPNFLNVISNVLFLLIGIYGLYLINKTKGQSAALINYATIFIALILTAIGSAWYHLHPNNDSLVFDRIPMTIIFMAFLSMAISECIDERAGVILLFPLILIGMASVLYWHFTEMEGNGDLRLYGFVQFYPTVMIPLIAVLFPSSLNRKGAHLFLGVLLWYGLAKLFEYYDREIFSFVKIVSGHSLKHLAAAISTWNIVRMFSKNTGKLLY